MPLVKLHLMKGKRRAHKKAVMKAIQGAMVSAFRVAATDVTQMLSEYDPEDVDGKGENFTYVEVIALVGRSKEAKKNLYRHMIENICAATDLQPTDMLITLFEIPKNNSGIRGGQMASEVDLGFKLEV